MAGKMVEMTFAIGATLAGSFGNAFGKAGQVLGEMQKQAQELQQVSGQVEGFQKLQEAVTKNQESMAQAQAQAKALEGQIAASKQATNALKGQYGEAQAEVERLTANLVRNKDAYRAAQLNVASLERQIRSSKTPTAELQRQYAQAQEEARRLGEAVKKGGSDLQQAQAKAKGLKRELQDSATKTRSLTNESRNLQAQAEKLQGSITRDSEALLTMQRELTEAGIDTRNLASEQQRLAAQSKRLADAQTRLQTSRAALKETREKLSWNNVKGDLLKAAGIGLSFGAPVMQAAEFEHAAARLNAVAFSGGGRDAKKDAESFKSLQAQARQLGRDTQFTAVQAAQSQENLARAGFAANEIIAAMPGLLDMAAAEGMDLAQAADIMASSLRGFGLEARDAARVSNILAQTSAASNSSIVGLGDSMKYVAPVAQGLGISIEETSAMLGIMANAGIKGSQGGTAIRAAFLRLSKEPKAVAKALGQLGIKARDAQGNMRDMPELLQALSNRMKDMGSADKMKYLSNIFGGEAASGMLAVMEAAVDGSLQNLTRLNRESSGQLQALSKSTGLSMDELRAGMQDADKYARSLGISFGDLSVYIAMLAQDTQLDVDTNKALTQAFSRVRDNAKAAQKAAKSFGVSLVGENGKMRDFNAILGDLSKSMKDMKPPEQLKSLTKIFGAEGAKAVQALMRGMSNGLYDQYSEIVAGANGVSKEMADKVLQSFWGQKELLKSAISDVMITVGDVLLPSVKEVVTTIGEWTASLGKLASENPEATKRIIGTIAAIAALNVSIMAMKYAWLGITYPFKAAKVAFDLITLKALRNADALTEAGKSAGLFSKISGKLTAGVKGIGKAFSAIGSGIAKVFSGIMSLGKSLITGLFSPLGLKIVLIAGAIAALAAGAYYVYKNWDKIKKYIQDWWNSWTIGDIIKAIKSYLANLWGYIKGALSGLGSLISDYALAACSYVKDLWNDFGTWWDSWTLDDVFAAVKPYTDAATTYVSEKWQDFKSWWDSWTLDDIFATLKPYIDTAKAYASQKWQDFKSWWDSWTLSDIFSPILEKGKAVWEKFVATVETVKDLASEKLSAIWDKTVAAYEQARSIIVNNVISPVVKFSWNALVEGWEITSAVISAGFERLKNFLVIDFSGFWDTLSSGFASVCNVIKDAWSGVTGFIKDTWNTASDYVSSAWKWTKGLFGYDTDAEDLQAQIQDITALNAMSEGFTQRVAEMTQAWQPFKASLGEGFEQIYSLMQGVADRIRSTVIPAVSELANALSRVAAEIVSIVQAGTLEVDVRTQNVSANTAINTSPATSYSRTLGGRNRGGWNAHAEGGIITKPEIALIGEAGREAIIPLEKQARGASLWYEAGMELGLLKNVVIPSAEAVTPLEDKTRGIPLWKAAGEEMGMFPTSSASKNLSAVFSPNLNITVNGGGENSEQNFRQIVSEMFEDMFMEFQNKIQRVSFE